MYKVTVKFVGYKIVNGKIVKIITPKKYRLW